MINKKYLKEYIRITEDWLFEDNNVSILDGGFIYYKEGDKVKVSLGTINNNGILGGAVIFVKYYDDYFQEVRKLKIKKLLKR